MTRDPDVLPWPSVEDLDRDDFCIYCECLPTEAHQPGCPLFVPSFDTLMQCDGCGVEFFSNCLCDHDCAGGRDE